LGKGIRAQGRSDPFWEEAVAVQEDVIAVQEDAIELWEGASSSAKGPSSIAKRRDDPGRGDRASGGGDHDWGRGDLTSGGQDAVSEDAIELLEGKKSPALAGLFKPVIKIAVAAYSVTPVPDR
jgi:hypothetical protein